MNTIHKLGTIDRAGSETYPTTYRIRACPKCYGVLFWTSRNQTSTTCDNCGTTVNMLVFHGPIDYAKAVIRTNPFSKEIILFAFYSLAQWLDHRLKLRKLLLYLFIRGLSYL